MWRTSGAGTGPTVLVVAATGGAAAGGGAGTGVGADAWGIVTTVSGCVGVEDSVLATVEGLGRKVVCGTGGMVPEGMVLAVGVTGGSVPVGITASEAVLAVELFVEGVVVVAAVAAGTGDATDGWGTATCETSATSTAAEFPDGAC